MKEKKAKVSTAVKNYVKKEIEVQKETKIYQNADEDDLTDGGSVFNIFNPSEGINQDNRIGSEVLLHEIEIHADVRPSTQIIGSTGAAASAMFGFGVTGSAFSNNRIIVFEDRMNTGTDPTVLEILQNADYRSGYNQNAVNEKRFKWLHDETFQLHPILVNINGTCMYDDRSTKIFKYHSKGHRTRVEWKGDSGTPMKNYLGLLLISDKTQDIVAGPAFRYQVTCRYTDA